MKYTIKLGGGISLFLSSKEGDFWTGIDRHTCLFLSLSQIRAIRKRNQYIYIEHYKLGYNIINKLELYNNERHHKSNPKKRS